VLEALNVWRLFPTQIESGLTLYTTRHIREWHQGLMSSRELLGILAELPSKSKFKEASERSRRVVEYHGDGELSGKLLLMPGIGQVPKDVTVVAEFIDWTHEQKVQARGVQELAALRVDLRPPGYRYTPDFTGLQEPVEAILAERKRNAKAQLRSEAQEQIHAGLYGPERR
jgi:hypothetical protein